MRRKPVGLIVLSVLVACVLPVRAAEPAALEKIDRALAAMNAGAATRHVRAEIAGSAWMIEQSGTLDGGWVRLAIEATLALDTEERRAEASRRDVVPAMANAPFDGWTVRSGPWGAAARVGAESRAPTWRRARPALRRAADRLIDLFPAALLNEARRAADASLDQDGRVGFSRGAEQLFLEFDDVTGVVSAYEIIGSYPDEMMRAPWGAIRTRGEYGFWWREPSGALLPRQVSMTQNGRPWMSLEVREFEFSAAAGSDLSEPTIVEGPAPPASVDNFPFSTDHRDIGPGVRVYFGAWNIAVVEQDDGLVVLDAPISPGYAKALFAQLEKDFPQKTVKAVFSTSSAWPHIGGVAAYAASGIPIYFMAPNRAILTNFLNAKDVKGDLRPAADGFRLGSGADAIVVRHAPGPELANVMFLVLPGRNLVWASDALQFDGQGVLQPYARQYVAELLQAVCKDIDSETVFIAMHAGPLKAADIARQFSGEAHPPCSL